jgi:hypothetical protein
MKKTSQGLRGFILPYAGIVVAGLLAHWLLLLTDYRIWDGWSYAHMLNTPGGPELMWRAFNEFGRPMDILFWYPMIGAENAHIWSKYLSLAAWIGSACLVFHILRCGVCLDPLESWAISVIYVVIPVFDMLGELSIWMNVCAVFLFWLACALAMRLGRGSLRIPLRLLCLLLFFLSFNLNSQLVWFYAVGVAFLFLREKTASFGTLVARTKQLAFRYADFLLLPPLFYGAKRIFTPTADSGVFANYNKPVFSLERIYEGYAHMLNFFIFGELSELVSSPLILLGASLVSVALAVWLTRRKLLGCRKTVDCSSVEAARLMLAGVFLLIASAFPYIVVDQNLASEGWLTRNCILAALPLGMLVVGLLVCANRIFLKVRPIAWVVPLAFLVSLWMGLSARNYLTWQAFGVKQEAIKWQLQEAIGIRKAVVIQLRDYFMIPRTIYYYHPIVWTYMAAQGHETPGTYVFDTVRMAEDQQTTDEQGRIQVLVPQIPITSRDLNQAIVDGPVPYEMERIPRTGAQAMLLVRPGKHGSDGVKIGAEYLWLKLTSPEKVPGFLKSVSQIDVFDLPPITAG